MFCPACRSEYLPGITRCPQCDLDLVDELPLEDEELLSETLVEIHRAAGNSRAHLIASVLKGSGIPVLVESTGLESPYPPLAVSQGVPLKVRASDAERAREVLRAALAGELEIG